MYSQLNSHVNCNGNLGSLFILQSGPGRDVILACPYLTYTKKNQSLVALLISKRHLIMYGSKAYSINYYANTQ